MFIYLARPIDQAQESSWLDSLTISLEKKLQLAKAGAFKPHQAYLCNPAFPEHSSFVNDINTVALYGSDAVVAILPSGIPTLGVPAEIETALSLNKPTVILTDILASVQISTWAARGATIIDLNNDSLPESDDLRAMLLRSPDPEDETGSEPLTPSRILFAKYDRGASPLTRAHPTDAGLDLATSEDSTLHGDRKMLPTGVYVSIPNGWYGRITGRSSALARWNIQVHEGIIDAGYTGELKIQASFLGLGHADIPAGTRLAQLILAPVWDGEVETVDELPTSLRGNSGWGSSGV